MRLFIWNMLSIKLASFWLLYQGNRFGSHVEATSTNGASPIIQVPPNSHVAIDEQLYSRQIAVYGKSAQQQLVGAHVVIYGGSGSLAAEVLKNLAMAGVGRISIVKPDSGAHRVGPEPYLKGSENDLVAYAQSLNSLVTIQQVDTLDSVLNASNVGSVTVVCVDNSVKGILACADKCRSAGAKCIGACVRGVCGLIMDDFLHHFVSDTDGESRKEIPLLSASLLSKGSKKAVSEKEEAQGSSVFQVELRCIDEDRFIDLGIADTAEILISSSGDAARVSHAVRVVNMMNPKSVVVSVDDEATATAIVSALTTNNIVDANSTAGQQDSKKHMTLRKCASTVQLAHKPLRDVLRAPRGLFTQSNGCLSPKKDTALSLTLLASFLALEENEPETRQVSDAAVSKKKRHKRGLTKSSKAKTTTNNAHSDGSLFRARVLTQLRGLGVEAPLKPIKIGGVVGADTIESVVGRFFRSASGGGVCPASVSVVGSLTAQETIKSITGVHMPVNQVLLFESLDSLLDDDTVANDRDDQEAVQHEVENDPCTDSVSHPTAAGIRANAVAVYGQELVDEIEHLRLFIVGAGAIGCELLKTLSLMGVGCGSSPLPASINQSEQDKGEDDEDDENVKKRQNDYEDEINDETLSSSSSWKSLQSGGIVVTDMDTIERSNLNRQLLYRARHIGLSKAIVAGEMIKTINPSMSIHSLTEKVSPDTETLFNSEFWSQIDVVLPALDNVDARLYVDSQCVRHKKWMIDSGTLGTKGSVQAVIPGLSESYASSADPPEDAIPLCTLKSFPYQPEHCIAWARSLFDRLFGEDVRALRTCLDAAADGSSNGSVSRKLLDACESLSPEVRASLCAHLRQPQSDPTAALLWARQLFNELFYMDVQALLKEHPMGQLDEDGVPFWSGSRRPPNPLAFDPSNEMHKQFVLWAATLRIRCFAGTSMCPDSQELLTLFTTLFASPSISASSAFNEKIVQDNSASAPEILATYILKMNSASRRSLMSSLVPEEFEKDDATLGHVDFVGTASNLRSIVYGLRTIDRLEAQRVAGKIVPAIATTTSLVSGLASLELLKIASERIRRRKRTSRQSGISGGKDTTSKSRDDLASWGNSILRSLARSLSDAPVPQKAADSEADMSISTSSVQEKDRILQKFRNSFVNVARPLLAFSQPVAAETYQCGDQAFSMWDTLPAPNSVEELTISALEEDLIERYGAKLQSVAYGDTLLYASFLPEAEYLSSLTVAQLLARSKQQDGNNESKNARDSDDNNDKVKEDVDNDDEDTDGESSAGEDAVSDDSDPQDPLSATLDLLAQKQFIDVDVACVDEDENDMRLPAVRIKCALDASLRHDDDADSPNTPKLKYKTRQSKTIGIYQSIKAVLLKFVLSWIG